MIWQPADYALQGLYRDTWVNIVYAIMGYQIAEKLRIRVAEGIKIPGSPDSTITISVGVAGYKKGYRQENWFAAADTALYAAKRAGRNRVIVSEPDGDD